MDPDRISAERLAWTRESVGILALTHEAFVVDTEETHAALTRWIGDLGPHQARGIAETMAVLAYALAQDAGFHLEAWLRELGMRIAHDEVPS